jgi:hypothetical protein
LERRWKEAAIAVHQGKDESLTELLYRLEVALNDFQVNDPRRATPEMIYSIYRSSLNERHRKRLERLHNFSNRIRDMDDEERIDLFRQCLYYERHRDEPPKQAKVNSVSLEDAKKQAAKKRWSCRTCQSEAHSFKTCDAARANAHCKNCNGSHFRFECPKRTPQETTRAGAAPAEKPASNSN